MAALSTIHTYFYRLRKSPHEPPPHCKTLRGLAFNPFCDLLILVSRVSTRRNRNIQDGKTLHRLAPVQIFASRYFSHRRRFTFYIVNLVNVPCQVECANSNFGEQGKRKKSSRTPQGPRKVRSIDLNL